MSDQTAVQSNNTAQLKTRWLGGLRCRSRIERVDESGKTSIILESDAADPDSLRGSERAASSVEHLLHALASSMTSSLVQGAEHAGITLELVVSYTRAVKTPLGNPSTFPEPLESIDLLFEIKCAHRATDLEQICANDPMYRMLRRSIPVHYSVIQAI